MHNPTELAERFKGFSDKYEPQFEDVDNSSEGKHVDRHHDILQGSLVLKILVNKRATGEAKYSIGSKESSD